MSDIEQISSSDEPSVDVEVQSLDDIDEEEVTEKVDTEKADTAVTEQLEEQVEDPLEEEDDDDFGAFSDASFDDFEEPQPQTHGPEALSTSGSFPQSLFSDKEQLRAKLEELANAAFPDKLPRFSVPDDTSILNVRSRHLLEQLTQPAHLKPYNWKRGSLRRQLLATLGLPDDTLEKKERKNEFDVESYVVKKLKDMGISEDKKRQLMAGTDVKLKELEDVVYSEDELNEMNEEELDIYIALLGEKVASVEEFLSAWEDEKSRLEEDHKTFESVVENLVGHTQRMRRDEMMKSLKKAKEKGKLNLFKSKKKKL
jgi:hypothetical protein